MNLCLNAFVIQFPDGLLDTCSVTAPRARLLPYAHRGDCKDEDSYKERSCWGTVRQKRSHGRRVPNHSAFRKRNSSGVSEPASAELRRILAVSDTAEIMVFDLKRVSGHWRICDSRDGTPTIQLGMGWLLKV